MMLRLIGEITVAGENGTLEACVYKKATMEDLRRVQVDAIYSSNVAHVVGDMLTSCGSMLTSCIVGSLDRRNCRGIGRSHHGNQRPAEKMVDTRERGSTGFRSSPEVTR